MIVPGQLTRSMWKRASAGFGATPSRTSVASIDFDDECWLNRHQSAFLPRVSESWSRAIRTVMMKKIVAFAIW